MTGAVLHHAIVGRVTEEAADALRARLEERIERREPFAVLFDRSAMTGPTPDGRSALARWAADLLPRMREGGCVAWADLYDARRAATLDRAAHDRGHTGDTPGPWGYVHRVFDSPDAAEAWLRARLP